MLRHGSTTILLAACGSSSHPNGMQQITGYPPVQSFGIRRREVEVCGCGVVASVTLILLVCCTVYLKIIAINSIIIIKIISLCKLELEHERFFFKCITYSTPCFFP